MDGEAEAYDDDGDCNGCPDGGGKRRPRGLGEGVAGVVGLRPARRSLGLSGGTGPRRKRLGACRRRCLGAGGLTKLCLRASVASGSLSDETTRVQTFSADEESWNAGKLSLDRGRQEAVSIYMYALCSLGWLAKRVAPVPIG